MTVSDLISILQRYGYEPGGTDVRWQLPLDLLTKAAKTMLKANETMNFSSVQQFFKPLTDDQVSVLARKHAGTPGIEQSIYLDEVGLQNLALEVLKAQRSAYKSALEREHLALLIANDLAALLAQEPPEQAEALLELVADIELASMNWVSACEKGEI